MVSTPPVQFATTSDGVRIAYVDTGGDGPPLLWTPGWVSHIELEWSSADISSFLQRIAANHRLIHFDGRGTGLSDRGVDDLSVATRTRDIEAVADALGIESFDLFAWSAWGPCAIIYAAEHPDRVRRLALYATYARFQSDKPELGRALLALIRAEWLIGSRTITDFVYPHVDHEHEHEFMDYFRTSASGEVAASVLEEGFFCADTTPYLSRLSMPTAVLHRRDDCAIDFGNGRQLASLISGTRFIPLAGDIHVPWHGDVDGLLGALEDFLGVTPAPAPTSPEEATVSTWAIDAILRATTVTLFFTDMESSTALTGRLGDAGAQTLVRVHNTIVRDALKQYGGVEIKHTGDGIMASFTSASAAVAAAIAIQRGLDRHNQEHPDASVRVRIGLNAGEPVAEEGDLFGSAVQLARRICDGAQAGEILVSNVVRELVSGKGFLFAERGEVAMRGFEDPARLYEVRWEP